MKDIDHKLIAYDPFPDVDRVVGFTRFSGPKTVILLKVSVPIKCDWQYSYVW